MTRVTRFAVIEQEHPASDFPLTGTIVGDDLYYVARSQLRAFRRKEDLARRKAEGIDHLEATARSWFVSASRGKINRSTREGTRKFFSEYFEGASYPQYEDLEPPIIRVSDDASMAWILSRTRVRRVDKSGKEGGFVYAGMMTYEKRNGRWVRVGNASTFE